MRSAKCLVGLKLADKVSTAARLKSCSLACGPHSCLWSPTALQQPFSVCALFLPAGTGNIAIVSARGALAGHSWGIVELTRWI